MAKHTVCPALLWQTRDHNPLLSRSKALGGTTTFSDHTTCLLLFLPMQDKAIEQPKPTICLIAFIEVWKPSAWMWNAFPLWLTRPFASSSPLQVSLSNSMLDVYGGEQGMNPPNGGMSPTSNTTKLTVKREFTGMDSYHGTELATSR